MLPECCRPQPPALQDAAPGNASLCRAAIQARMLGRPTHRFLFFSSDVTRTAKAARRTMDARMASTRAARNVTEHLQSAACGVFSPPAAAPVRDETVPQVRVFCTADSHTVCLRGWRIPTSSCASGLWARSACWGPWIPQECNTVLQNHKK